MKRKRKSKKQKIDLRLYKNLTEDEDYKKRLKEQNGNCAICHRLPKKVRLSRDHNHTTGKPRGLLCMICNRKILGAIERFRVIPEAIVKYLEKFDPENTLLIKRKDEQKET